MYGRTVRAPPLRALAYGKSHGGRTISYSDVRYLVVHQQARVVALFVAVVAEVRGEAGQSHVIAGEEGVHGRVDITHCELDAGSVDHSYHMHGEVRQGAARRAAGKGEATTTERGKVPDRDMQWTRICEVVRCGARGGRGTGASPWRVSHTPRDGAVCTEYGGKQPA
jgi:hypothetical protein